MKYKQYLAMFLALTLLMCTYQTVSGKTKECEVTLYDYYGNILDRDTVAYGSNYEKSNSYYMKNKFENMPSIPDKKFVKWDIDMSKVTKDISAHPIYRDYVPHVILTKTVAVGDIFNFALAPVVYDVYRTSWTSSNKKIATVTNRGVATALKAGTTTIKFKSYTEEGDTYIFECELIVSNNVASTPYVEMTSDRIADELPVVILSDTITVGEKITFDNFIDFDKDNSIEVSWNEDNCEVFASYDDYNETITDPTIATNPSWIEYYKNHNILIIENDYSNDDTISTISAPKPGTFEIYVKVYDSELVRNYWHDVLLPYGTDRLYIIRYTVINN